MLNSYDIRLTVTADTPFRNLAIDCVLEVLRAANIEADVQDDSEYGTPEQERENNLASWFFLSFADDRAVPGRCVRACPRAAHRNPARQGSGQSVLRCDGGVPVRN